MIPRSAATDVQKTHIAASFGKAAAGYDAAADVQHQVAERLASRIARWLPDNPRILEIGCGTGLLTGALSRRAKAGNWVITDLSEEMVRYNRLRFAGLPNASFAVMDGELPCFPEREGFDLICSSLAFQWFEDLPKALKNLSRLLAPGGRLSFATLVAGSFAEWRDCVSARGFQSGIRRYPTTDEMRGAMLENGLSSVEEEDLVMHYPSAASFLSALKRIGAGLPDPTYRPLPAGVLRSILRDRDGGMPITYRLAFGDFQLNR